MHVEETKTKTVLEVNGLQLWMAWNADSSQAGFLAHQDADTVGMSGLGEVDDAFKAYTAQDTRYVGLFSRSQGGGRVAANFDVLARNLQSPNKWTHWVIGLYNDGSGDGCGVWGNVNPPSN